MKNLKHGKELLHNITSLVRYKAQKIILKINEKKLGAWGNSPNQHKRQDRKMFKVEHLTYSDLFVFLQV